jgi:SAM-dependent methyltransferase
MHSAKRHTRIAIVALILASSAWGSESRQECERSFAPRSGQAGKDVIWVPTQDDLVMEMLKAAKVTADDYVVDLGSGDGRIPIAAAKHFGAKALGLEFNPEMVKLAQCYVRAENLTNKVEIKQADIFETDFSDATVVTMYLLSNLNMKLRPTILKMKPGTRVVSNSFKMGEWNPDEFIEPENTHTRAYFWIVPAQVSGAWTLREQGGPNELQLTIEQQFQELDVQVQGEGARLPAKGATLRGSDIAFTLVDAKQQPQKFAGKVEQDTMRVSAQQGTKTVTYIGKRD